MGLQKYVKLMTSIQKCIKAFMEGIKLLKLKGITKEYITGGSSVMALKGINLEFREHEFVSILGHSGCGKTTLLNIIGGLDRYTDGDLIINGKSTKTFKDADWDTYRNHSIGFVFQSYNLIPHQTVLANVELALTLSGVSKKERRQRAIEALTKVGLADQIEKHPAQMSGGQMQRVAIARALVNDPDILLADEPTGALDTETSVQIMEILKEISKDKLIIMVTHNPDLAQEYSTRIIKVLDGLVINDSDPYKQEDNFCVTKKNDNTDKKKKTKKTSMSFFTALSLSFNNLKTKKGRTIITSFAGSIGIIGIALILSLSSGISTYINDVQRDALSSFPISIYSKESDLSGMISSLSSAMSGESATSHENDAVYSNPIMFDLLHNMSSANIKTNNLKLFKEYLDKESKGSLSKHITAIQYTYDIDLNMYVKDENGEYSKSDITGLFTAMMGGSSSSSGMMGMSNMFATYDVWSEMLCGEKNSDGTYKSYVNDLLLEQYDLVYGKWPESKNEVILVLDSNNEITDITLYTLGMISQEDMINTIVSAMRGDEDYSSEVRRIEYSDICNKSFKLILNTDYYEYNSVTGLYEDYSENEEFMKLKIAQGLDIKISGIVRPNEDASSSSISGSLAYTAALTEYIIEKTNESDLAKAQLAQENKNRDVFTGLPFINDKKGELTESQKIAELKKYIADSTNAKKADLYLDIMCTPSEEYISQTLKSYKDQFFGNGNSSSGYREMLADLIISQGVMPGLDKETILTYIQAYSDEELEKMIDEYLREEIVSSYAASMKAKITSEASLPSNEILAGVKAQLSSAILSQPGITKITYLAGIYSESTSLPIESIMQSLMQMTSEQIDEMFDNKMNEAALAYCRENIPADQNTINANIAAMLDLYIENADNKTLRSVYENNMPDGISENSYDDNLKKIGICDLSDPYAINIYADSFESKEAIASAISDYNDDHAEEDRITYTDYVALLMSSVSTIINAISYVLVAFVSISLIVSSIMIGIITNISVLERTKEIGILRAIGASKKDVSRVFNAETLIIGSCAGLLGILVTVLLCIPINAIIHSITGINNINAALPPLAGLILVIISMMLTLIAGLIPSRSAAKKDPVIALRTE